MSTSAPKIKIATVGDNSTYFAELRKQLNLFPNVYTFHCPFPNFALDSIRKGEANLIVLDIFDVGIIESIELIKSIGIRSPHIPVILVGERDALSDLPGVPSYWKQQLNQYYKLNKDKPITDIQEDASDLYNKFKSYLMTEQHPSSTHSDNLVSYSSVFTISVLLGAVGISIADALPIGINSGRAFIIVFLFCFVLLSIALLISEWYKFRNLAETAPENIVLCPICRNSLVVTTGLHSLEATRTIRGRFGNLLFGGLAWHRSSSIRFSEGESIEEEGSDPSERITKWR